MCAVNCRLTGNATSLVDVALGGDCATDLECGAATAGATCVIPNGEDTGVCTCVAPLQPHEGDTPVCYQHEHDASCDEDNECLGT